MSTVTSHPFYLQLHNTWSYPCCKNSNSTEGGSPSRNQVPKEDSRSGAAMHGARRCHTTCSAGSRKGHVAVDSRHHRVRGTGRVPRWGCGWCPGQGPLQPPCPSITHTLGCPQGLVCPFVGWHCSHCPVQSTDRRPVH